MKDLLQSGKRFEIEAYKKPKNAGDLKKAHVPFSGSPLKHPYDPERVILVADPFGRNNLYYEFRSRDISFIEELPGIVDVDGKAVMMVRVWVKKMSVAILSMAFLVGETGPDLS